MSTNHALLEILASLWHGSCGLVMFHCFVKVWQVQHRMDLINYSEHVNSTEYIYIYTMQVLHMIISTPFSILITFSLY